MKRVAGVPWREKANGEPRSVTPEAGPAAETGGAQEERREEVDFEEMEWEPVEHGEEPIVNEKESRARLAGDSD